jgi:hypothetical protein
MAKYTKTISADTTGTFICNCKKKRDQPSFKYTILGYGTWGSGTLTWYVSPDAGTTLIAMTDLTDAALSMTANKFFDGELGGVSSSINDVLSIWVKMSGSSSPSVIAAVYDNNG